MKFLIAFVALVAVAAAGNKPTDSQVATMEAIIAAINNPSTDPATAVLLEQQLQEIVTALMPEEIAVGPAIVDSFEPIAVGPALVDLPVGDGGAVTAPESPAVAPAVVAPVQPSSAPLVQIILNINQAASDAAAVSLPVAEPVSVVDVAPEPVSVVEAVVPLPAIVGTPVLPQVVAPVAPIAPVSPISIMPLPAIINH